MTTGKTQRQRSDRGAVRPFPVQKVIKGLCHVMRGLEMILRPLSLYLYKLNIIDRKWMDVLMFVVNLLQFACDSMLADNKLKDTEL